MGFFNSDPPRGGQAARRSTTTGNPVQSDHDPVEVADAKDLPPRKAAESVGSAQGRSALLGLRRRSR